MVDLAGLLHPAIYGTFGRPAVLTPTSGAAVALSAIDDTGATEQVMSGDGVVVHSIVPRARVRMVELAAAGVARSALPGGEITLNGKTWRIESTRPLPTNRGEADGELELHLIETEASA